MTSGPLRFASFLAPIMFPVYQFIADYVGKSLGVATTLAVGKSFADFAAGDTDVGFICGLPYVQLTREQPAPIELLAAPIIEGERYGEQPIYYSDVIVRRESCFRSFADLRGCSWSYNDPDSHSGYNITRERLVQMGEINGYFGEVVAAGWHQRSIEMVCAGEVDASAIDSHVLALALREQPTLAEQLRIIDVLGPATIQPVVAASRLPEDLKAAMREVLLGMAADPLARQQLAAGLIERFAPVTDATYNDIRAMVARAEAVGFMRLR